MKRGIWWKLLLISVLAMQGCQSSGSSGSDAETTQNESDHQYSENDDGESDGYENASSAQTTASSSSANASSSGSVGGSSDSQTPSQTAQSYALMAWNDLGMHCMDGDDYSVFSILPPYNNLHAQIKSKNGDLVSSGITMTYEALASANGIKNTTSMYDAGNNPKTNFWSYVDKLFGTSLSDDTGLTGSKTPTTQPLPMTFNTVHHWWEAEGIPLTPIDDNGNKNFYPRVKVTAKNSSGAVIAEATTVLPVSDEMDCRACHASNGGYSDARPAAGWVNDSDTLKDYKRNILRLHDDKHSGAVADNLSALEAKGYKYERAGLEATQSAGTPILCAACHSSNALPGTGIAGIKPLTQAIHSLHATVSDPDTGMALESVENRDSCYRCHPGQATQCLRGAMGNAKNSDGPALMDCQSCHGTMSQVGSNSREGWLDQPNCQACHQNGARYTSALSNGTLRQALDTRFATNTDTPAPGYSLYRFSKGHGDLQCESCHGATHAIYPSHEAGDNLLSESLQGHSGTVGECSACHASVPRTGTGGPHGMHPVGQSWVSDHEDYAEGHTYGCTACHGSDYRGSDLARTWSARSFRAEGKTKIYAKGDQVTCYDCHNGPGGH